ncbi:MAG: hypothetical protein AAF614_15475 [Chloroflexota bacterium]
MASTFVTQTRLALEHFNDPDWLGKNSPLAAPYFLSHLMNEKTISSSERGRLLQQLLYSAAAHLWGDALPGNKNELAEAAFNERDTMGTTKSPRYGYLLLELFYFRRHFPSNQLPTTRVQDVLNFVASSRTRFYSHLRKSVGQVAERLLRLVNPTFRLETPQLRQQPIGRQDILAHCLTLLRQGDSVALSGGGGIGKTTLATAVRQAWQQDRSHTEAEGETAVFWHTIRPKLTDTLESILFSLGYFLHQHGASTLWHQAIASHGQPLDKNLTLGLLRDDIKTLHKKGKQPLICFDEIDQLGQLSQRTEQQIATLEFIAALQEQLPLLILGQYIPLDTTHHIHLSGLTKNDIDAMLNQAEVSLAEDSQARLQAQTQGNPRLLEIYIALLKSGDPIFDSVHQLRQTPAIPALLERLWNRLTPSEQHLLGQLAVFRLPAPADAWPRETVSRLEDRALAQIDAHNGIILLPLIREVLLELLTSEQKESYHEQAAAIWAERGAYTASAYHFWQAGEWETAVSHWYPHRQLEIERGQATAALAIFKKIYSRPLSPKAQRQLTELRNQLFLLAGDAKSVLTTTTAPPQTTSENIETQQREAAILHQEGRAAHILGNVETSLEKHESALVTLGKLTNKYLEIQFTRNNIYTAEGNHVAAFAGVQRAKYETARLEGVFHWRAGNYSQADEQLRVALDLAQSLQSPEAAAQIHRILVYNAGTAGQLSKAESHAKQAIRYYRQIGDQISVTGIQANLAAAYINQGNFTAAIPPSEKALAFFKKIKSTSWIASISSNLAEAYFETGNIAKAREAAFEVLRQEEPFTHPYALYTLGLIHEHDKAFDNAQESFQRGIKIAQHNDDKFILAYLQRVLGQLHQRQAQDQLAQQALKTAVSLFTALNLEEEVEKTAVLLQTYATPEKPS